MRAKILQAVAALGIAALAAPAIAAPAIEIAQRSGVAGFQIGIFGSGFGAARGNSSVTIGGVAAPVTYWSDTLVKATVPQVADQSTQLVVTVGGVASSPWPFQVYSIDPTFLAPSLLENITKGKQAVITGHYTDYGSSNPPCDGGRDTAPYFLSYNSCDGSFLPDSGAFTVALPLGQATSGAAWFTWFGDGSGYPNSEQPGHRYPASDYVLEQSTNSTTGTDGTWTTLATVSGNAYWSRIHKVVLSGATWFRWRVTALSGGNLICKVNEVGLYRVKPGASGAGIDSWGIIGSSSTAHDLNHGGDLAFWGRAFKSSGDGTMPLGYVYGLSGARTNALLDLAPSDQMSGATLPEMLDREPDIRYVGIALGINDYGYTDSGTTAATDRNNLEAGIKTAIAKGRVPVLARIQDTTDVLVPPATFTMKALILKNEDELAAQYRLVPGPDFYTHYREHPELIDGSGIHHVATDFSMEILWAQAILRAGPRGSRLDSLAPAVPKNLRVR